MRAQRVWKPVGADPHHAEIAQLHRELATFNNRIASLEKMHAQSMTIETLKAGAILLAQKIDEVRCSLVAAK
jgi:hypothetical protein